MCSSDLIERDVKPYITEYYSVDSSNLGWSAYPFAATFANPTPGTSGSGTTRAQSTYVGTAGLSIGLLPITSSASYSWTSGSGTVTLQTPTKAGSISGTTCVTSSTSWRCTFTVNALNSVAICGSTTRYCIVTPTIRISGQIGTNAGKS